MWHLLGKAMEAACGQNRLIEVRWTKAHPKPHHVKKYGLSTADILGNAYADEAAKRGAGLNPTIDRDVEFSDAITWTVQQRIIQANLAAIQADPTAEFAPKAKKVRRSQRLVVLQRESGHELRKTEQGKHYLCQNCGGQVALKAVFTWLNRTKCLGHTEYVAPTHLEAPLQIQPQAALLVGHQNTHPSHVLAYYRGLLWCWRCGASATHAPGVRAGMKLLANTCKGAPTRSGQNLLSRIRRGLTLRVDYDWPRPPQNEELLPELQSDHEQESQVAD